MTTDRGVIKGCGGKTTYFLAECDNISKIIDNLTIRKLHVLSIGTKIDDLDDFELNIRRISRDFADLVRNNF